MDVSAIMTHRPVTVSPETGLDEALRLMADEDVRHLPIMGEGGLLGVLSERDLLAEAGWLPRPEGEAPSDADGPRNVVDVMHADPTTVMPEDTLVTACVSFQVDRIGCLPVMDGNNALVGLITESDVLAAFWKACREGNLEGDVDPPIRAHMTTRLATLPASTDLADATAHAADVHGRHFPVVADGRLVGILSDRDLRAAHGEGRRDDTPVADLMSTDVVTLGPDAPLSEAARLMAEGKLGALPVVEGERLLGILTLTDVVEHCLGTLREPEPRR